MLRPLTPKTAYVCTYLVCFLTYSSHAAHGMLLAQLAHSRAKTSSHIPELCCRRTSSSSVPHDRHCSSTCRQQTPTDRQLTPADPSVRQPCKTWHVASSARACLSQTKQMHTSAMFFKNKQFVSVTYSTLVRRIPPPSNLAVKEFAAPYACRCNPQ